jgi:hypothetical protein
MKESDNDLAEGMELIFGDPREENLDLAEFPSIDSSAG